MNMKGCLIGIIFWAAGYEPDAMSHSFHNLDFEESRVPFTAPGAPGNVYPADQALPGWTTYYEETPGLRVFHNTQTLGGAALILYSPAWNSRYILQGNYSLGMAVSSAPVGGIMAGIGQTGQVPGNAQSLRFYSPGFVELSVELGGEPLLPVLLEEGLKYNIWGADIKRFAGQSVELRFTGGALLDNIQFSPLAIPEPTTFALLGAGFSIFGWGRWRRSVAGPNEARNRNDRLQ